MDYDLTRLGTREFEHVTQALALGVLGPAVSVFGDGPDGGREAVVEGKISWSAGEEWDGHTVIQAKLRQRPLGTGEDTAWLMQQVDGELKRWADSALNRSKKGQRPEYFIIATNVTLSAVPGSGGIDRLNALIERHARRLGLLGWRIWHHDQLCRFLDNNEDVRRAYTHLITPGDVLARLTAFIDISQDLAESMATFVEADLLAAKWIRLSEAGHPMNEKIELACAAIDLPAVVRGNPKGQVVRAGQYIIEHGDQAMNGTEDASPSHLVLVGGPGQGKTTLGQLICQVYRVAMIGTTAAPGSDTHDAVTALNECFARVEFPAPVRKRWPVRIELAKYADAIAGGEGISLLRYIAEQISARISDRVTPWLLKDWLRSWPWIVVLDGLDEVAAASSRDEVTSRISDFLIEARHVDADVVVLVTTRPQGYAGEFHERHHTHLDLEPLATRDALAYATVLAGVRHSDDPDLRTVIGARMRQAAEDEATARLMTSPLQVTIMSLLLEARERAPQARFALFDAYYSTIYAREMGKPGPTGLLLERYRRHIDAIHNQVGLRLHLRAENAGESDAALPRADLRQLAVDRLIAEGHDRQQAEILADRIIDAATSRLVLLVAKDFDHVGYEVRSLQEFAAARALTDGTDVDVMNRLRALTCTWHWRNIWLFAAGRLFAEREHLRAGLVGLLHELDMDSEINIAVMPGAELAAELLAEGVAQSAPAFARMLLQRALAILDCEFRNNPGRLGELGTIAASDAVMTRDFKQRIEAALQAGGSRQSMAVWLLFRWREDGGPLARWARQIRPRWATQLTPIQRFLLSHQSPDTMPRNLDVGDAEIGSTQAGNLADLIRPSVLSQNLQGHDFTAADALLASLEEFSIYSVRGAEGRILVAQYVSFVGAAEIPDALERKNVADAFAFALVRLSADHWAVAGAFQFLLQGGARRVPAGPALRTLLPEL